jgi:sensor histidine kinase YesM
MMNFRVLYRYKLHHILLWTGVFGFWLFLRYQDYSTTEKALVVTAIKVADLALLIYLVTGWLVPKLLYKKRYFLFTVLFLLLVAGSSLLKMKVLGTYLNNPALLNWNGNWKLRFYDNILPHFFLVTAGLAFKLLIDSLRLQRKLAVIAREKAEAELSFLKSQINPHFLFNALNTVYFLIDKGNTPARKALHQFSGMLRYQLYECGDAQVPVEKEIAYLKDYVSMQQLRMGEGTVVRFHWDPELAGLSIEPLLLLPFVENAFKHLGSEKESSHCEVDIRFQLKDGNLLCLISNTTGADRCASESGGIGLTNVEKRLSLLYPGRHHLKTTHDGGWYSVALQINLTTES